MIYTSFTRKSSSTALDFSRINSLVLRKTALYMKFSGKLCFLLLIELRFIVNLSSINPKSSDFDNQSFIMAQALNIILNPHFCIDLNRFRQKYSIYCVGFFRIIPIVLQNTALYLEFSCNL